jgi:hypothetical protein
MIPEAACVVIGKDERQSSSQSWWREIGLFWGTSQMPRDNQIEKVPDPDRVGKVFVMLGRGIRLCLICECVLTSQAAAELSGTICHPPEIISTDIGKK